MNAKNISDTTLGTQLDVNVTEWMNHSIYAKDEHEMDLILV
jgi:hypothetical protein